MMSDFTDSIRNQLDKEIQMYESIRTTSESNNSRYEHSVCELLRLQNKSICDQIVRSFPTLTSTSVTTLINGDDRVGHEKTTWIIYYDPIQKDILGLRREISRTKGDVMDLLGIREAFLIDEDQYDTLLRSFEFDLDHLIKDEDVCHALNKKQMKTLI